MKTENKRTIAAIAENIGSNDQTRLEPEFVRINDLRKIFGIKRGFAYLLIKRRAIKAILLRVPGSQTGIRLVHVESVRQFINGQARDALQDAKGAESSDSPLL